MKNLPDFSLFLEKNYGLQLAKTSFAGESNEFVFKIQTIDNQCFGLKIYRSAGAPSPEKLAEIWSYVAFLAGRKIAVQSPVLSLEKQLVTAFFFEPVSPFGGDKTCPVVLFNWLDGKNLTRWATAATVKKWGELLGGLHCTSADFFIKKEGADGLSVFSKKTNLTRIDSNFVKKTIEWLPDELPKQGFSKNESALFSEKLEKLAENDDFFEIKNSSFGLIHSDLHPGNLLRTGQKLTAIDWDDLAFGPFLLDIAIVFNEMRRFPAEKSLPLQAAFLEGYRAKFDLPDHFEKQFPAALDLADMLFASWVFHPKNEFARTDKLLKLGEKAVREILNGR